MRLETKTMHVTRTLRRKQTPWELKLWNSIRNRQISGMKFRRQYKIGPYVVDFVCLENELVIELDGGHHGEDKIKESDLIKQKYIESLGFKVIRFWNNEIDSNLDGVIQTLLQYS